MDELTGKLAQRIIQQLGQSGQPPQFGVQFFTAGLDPYLKVIDSEYLDTFIRDGGSAFKMVVGVYGGGKTHFLYCVRDLAWKYNYAVSYVSLSSTESPFHKLELVYRAVANGLTIRPSGDEIYSNFQQGLKAFFKTSYYEKLEALETSLKDASVAKDNFRSFLTQLSVESTSFTKAVRSAYEALLDEREERFEVVLQWLSGEAYDKKMHKDFGILEKLDKSTAPRMLRSLTQFVRQMGFAGLLVLFDEAERVPSLSSKQKEQHLNNLREIIDECGKSSLNGVMLFYAVPDENFLEGRTQVYEALKQRLASPFERFNPTGVKIDLERLSSETETDPVTMLAEIGDKVAGIYEKAYNHAFDRNTMGPIIRKTADEAYGQRFGDTGFKRVFVTNLIARLEKWHRSGEAPSLE